MDQAFLAHPRASAFVDDITIRGFVEDWKSLWVDSLAALKSLAAMGFMINLRKTKFMVRDVTLLGLHVGRGVYQLGEKCLKGWYNI
jgi:hypothetical protein